MMQSRKKLPSVLNRFKRPWQICLQFSFCSCVSTYGTQLVWTLQYSNITTIFFQCIEAGIHLCTHISGHNVLIHVDEMIETLLILWCDAMHGTPGMWLIFHILVAIANMHHPPPYSAHICCLVSINILQASMNINGCKLSCMEEFSDIPLLHVYFHVRYRSVWLPLCCYISHGNKM